MFTLTKSEHEVLETMWKIGRPLYRSEIVSLSADRSWSVNTIPAILTGLLNKGAIQVDGFVRAGKTFARAYVPTITAEEYALMQFTNNMPSEPGKNKLERIFAALMNMEETDQETLNALRRIIDRKEEELNA